MGPKLSVIFVRYSREFVITYNCDRYNQVWLYVARQKNGFTWAYHIKYQNLTVKVINLENGYFELISKLLKSHWSGLVEGLGVGGCGGGVWCGAWL